MKIALFGGSFDPPHIGHLAVGKHLADSGEFDEVWVLPSFRHPFAKESRPYEERLALCRLAFEGLDPKLKVSMEEREAQSPQGFTVDLLRHLRKKYPKHHFFWIMGSDLQRESSRWKDFEEIKKLAEIYPIARKGYEDSPFPQVSSTELRLALKERRDVSKLIPRKVLEEIERRGWYR